MYCETKHQHLKEQQATVFRLGKKRGLQEEHRGIWECVQPQEEKSIAQECK